MVPDRVLQRVYNTLTTVQRLLTTIYNRVARKLIPPQQGRYFSRGELSIAAHKNNSILITLEKPAANSMNS